jgi:hypothetical protein
VLIRAGVPESLARRTHASLKLLGLIDENDQPTEQLNALKQARGDDEYRTRLQEWLRGLYVDVLQYTDPSTDASDKVAEAFRTYEPAGQRRAMAALFVGLWKYAGLPVPAESAAQRSSGARPPRVRPPDRPQARQTSNPKAKDDAHTPTGLPPGLVGLLQQIPRGNDTWTTKRRDDFLNAFRAVLDFTVPVDDSPVSKAIDEEDEP